MYFAHWLAAAALLTAAPALAQTEADPAEGEAVEGVPWQAQIYSNFTDWTEDELAVRADWDLAHRCGGSLIAEGWVLTAAHCINQEKVDKGYRVRLGASYLDDGEGVTYRIDRMVRHADWNGAKHLYDIALVHYIADNETLEIDAGPIEPIALYDGPPLGIGVKVFATGWGQAEEGLNKGFQAELTQVDLTTVDCRAYPQYRDTAPDYTLCASAPDTDTCTGDSGGPLVLDEDRPLLVGIVSWGRGCYRDNSAGVYVRIDQNHFRDWIERAMASDPSVNILR